VIAFQEGGPRDPGTYEVPFPPLAPEPPPEEPSPSLGQQQPPPPAPLPPAEGRWTLTVNAVDDQGLPSSAMRRFAVNSTLGFLRVEPARLVLPPTGAFATVRWTQTRVARVRVTVETLEGVLVRTVALRTLQPGPQAVTWNGRHGNGKLAAGGRYVVRVVATNGVGGVELSQELVVRRIAGR
jgi:hypothetical protein